MLLFNSLRPFPSFALQTKSQKGARTIRFQSRKRPSNQQLPQPHDFLSCLFTLCCVAPLSLCAPLLLQRTVICITGLRSIVTLSHCDLRYRTALYCTSTSVKQIEHFLQCAVSRILCAALCCAIDKRQDVKTIHA